VVEALSAQDSNCSLRAGILPGAVRCNNDLLDVEPEFQEFPVCPRASPKRIRRRTVPDQIPDLLPLDTKSPDAKNTTMPGHKDWNYAVKVLIEHSKAVRYSLAFWRQRNGWYDQIRYDSHDRKRGKNVQAPHFHMKLRTGFKEDAGKAVEEIKSIIDNYLQRLEEFIQ